MTEPSPSSPLDPATCQVLTVGCSRGAGVSLHIAGLEIDLSLRDALRIGGLIIEAVHEYTDDALIEAMVNENEGKEDHKPFGLEWPAPKASTDNVKDLDGSLTVAEPSAQIREAAESLMQRFDAWGSLRQEFTGGKEWHKFLDSINDVEAALKASEAEQVPTFAPQSNVGTLPPKPLYDGSDIFRFNELAKKYPQYEFVTLWNRLQPLIDWAIEFPIPVTSPLPPVTSPLPPVTSPLPPVQPQADARPAEGGYLFHEALEAWRVHYQTGDNDGADVYEANASSYDTAKALTERYFANIPVPLLGRMRGGRRLGDGT